MVEKKPQWESLTAKELIVEGDEITDRLEVPGGWIYRTRWRMGNDVAVALCFVPNPLLTE